MPRSFALLAMVFLALAGCTRMPGTGVTVLKPATVSELQGYLLTHKADLEQFRLRGPFAVAVQIDNELRLPDGERISSDFYAAAPAEKAPLVIFLHGYASSKEAHAYQALHLASWGMHCLILQLSKVGPWTSNGKTLARVVDLIHRRPETVDSRIDVKKIILVGHSFGGSSVMIALAEGAPATGAILLDPAAVGRELPAYLTKVNAPIMLLGADENVSETRNRSYFYRYVKSGIAEVSIKDATHEDAQYPSDFAQTTEELQITFVSTLTAAALSLSSTGKLDYAWDSFGDAFKSGKLLNANRK